MVDQRILCAQQQHVHGKGCHCSAQGMSSKQNGPLAATCTYQNRSCDLTNPLPGMQPESIRTRLVGQQSSDVNCFFSYIHPTYVIQKNVKISSVVFYNVMYRISFTLTFCCTSDTWLSLQAAQLCSRFQSILAKSRQRLGSRHSPAGYAKVGLGPSCSSCGNSSLQKKAS